MKKLLYKFLITTILLSNSIYTVTAEPIPNAEKIINSKGQEAKVFTSEDAIQTIDDGAKSSVEVSFIEDPYNSDLIALVSLKGFIPSGIKRDGGYWSAKLYWPRKYDITVESQNNDNVKIIETIPNNKTENTTVNQTMGYNIGGSLTVNTEGSANGVSGGVNAGVTGGYNYSKTISYEQQNFKTIQKSDGIRKSAWNIEFVSTRDGYDIHSSNGIYGNELFMKTRYYNTGINNLTDDKDLPTLISGGFTPNMVIALKAPKDTQTSELLVSYDVHKDVYTLSWVAEWRGENKPHELVESNHLYEINWQEHTIKEK